MKILTQKGFTLIELLVVISIIGLLSSVVLASLTTARDKGQKAAGQIFARHNFGLLGASAFGYYDFNNTSAGPVDFSQYKRNGALVGAAYNGTFIPGNSGSSLYFDNVDDRVDISGGTNYTPPRSFTLMAWVYQMSIGSDTTNANDAIMGFAGANGETFQLTNGQIRFFQNPSQIFTASVVKRNTWTHIAMVVESNVIKFYSNGREVPITSTDSYNFSRDLPMLSYIGNRDSTSANTFGGYLDDVGVFPTPLTYTQIQEIYVQGLPTHSVADAQ